MTVQSACRCFSLTCRREKNRIFRSRIFAVAVAVSFLSSAILGSAANAQTEPRASNIRFELREKKITILYDLIGAPGETYKVVLHLRREDNAKFSYDPRAVVGDVGKDTSPGRDRKIVWDLIRDFPGGLNGDGYYFTITVEKPSSNILLWAGAIVLSGGIMGLLLFSSSGEKPKAPSFPAPPGRP